MAPNGATLNIGGGDLALGNFVDIMHVMQAGFSGGATPNSAGLDSNGYPTKSFSGTISFTEPLTGGSGFYNVPYVAVVPAGTKLAFTSTGGTQASSCSVLSGTAGSYTGCLGGNVTITFDGTGAAAVQFTPTGQFTINFSGASSYGAAGTANLAIVRATDYANYLAYGNTDARGIFTPEYLSLQAGTNAKNIRPMGWVDSGGNNLSSDTAWNYRTPVSALSWNTGVFPTTVWSSSITYAATGNGSCTTVGGSQEVYTASATTDTAGAPVDGSVIQGVIPTTNTTAQPYLCVGGAQYPVVTPDGLTTGAGIVSSGQGTFIFDGITHRWLNIAYIVGGSNPDGGLTATLPIEAQVLLANYLNRNLWITIPAMANSNYVTQQATAALNLKTGLYGIFEYSNEIWNFSFPQTQWANQRGLALGFPQANNEPASGWYGLRIAQYLGSTVPSVWAGRTSNLRRYLGYQAFGDPAATKTYRMKGADLANNVSYSNPVSISVASPAVLSGWFGHGLQSGWPVVMSTTGSLPTGLIAGTTYYVLNPNSNNGTLQLSATPGGAAINTSGTQSGTQTATYTNPYYASIIGVAYNAKPNRPVDFIESKGYAPYTAGTNFSDQGVNGGTAVTSINAPFLQTLATALNSNPNDPTSIASLDNDFRQGTASTLTYNSGTSTTFSCPTGTTFSTSAAHGFSNTNPGNNNMVAIFTATGGTVCNGLTAGKGYCFINVTSTTFQIAAFNSDGTCGSTPIGVSPGTGTTSVGPANDTTLAALTAHMYPQWEAVAAAFDSDRPAGMSALRVEWYEGAPEPLAPPATGANSLTSVGVTVAGSAATANAALQAGLTSWKNNADASALILAYYNAFMALTHSKTPSHLVLPGGGQYSLTSGTLPTSAKYQLYNGFASFVGVP